MANRETAILLGLVMGLVGATIVPFAMPALQFGGGASQIGQGDKSVPAGVADDNRPSTPTSDGRFDQVPLRPPNISCQPGLRRDLPHQFPLTIDGERFTGQGVTVAIVDPSGFDVDDPRIAEDVAETRSFSSQGSDDIANSGEHKHGTESAALVSRIAPDASLYLANFQKAVDFTEAIDWAIEQDVDVIVAPTTFYAKPNDGSAPVSQAVTKATERGIPVVVPTGNVAQRHWEGTYDDGPWLEFSPNDTRLYLRGTDRPVRSWLWWNETRDSGPNEFRVVLYEDLGDRSKRIATSTDYPKGPVGANQVLFETIRSNHLLSTAIGNGTYYIRIKGPDNTAHRIELVTAAHPVATPVPWGSLMAPATANGSVVAVGAASETGQVLPTSSRGPTNDGQPGIDLLAPGTVKGSTGATFQGTSAATAYTGGIVALMAAEDPSLMASRAEAILQSTAVPTGPNTANVTAGHGLIDPFRALTCLSDD